MLGNVKGIQDVESPACFLGNDLQVGLPHVGANYGDALHETRAIALQFGEALLEGSLGAPGTRIEQTALSGVDLVNESDVVGAALAPAPVDFIHPKAVHLLELAMRQAMFHHPFHTAAHRLPVGTEH